MLSGFQIMWLVVAFDLPVGTKTEQRRATRFRNMLLDEGFFMKQFSIYLRHSQNRATADALAERIGKQSPPEGDVSIMFFTDKQYGMTRNYCGQSTTKTEEKPRQFMLL